MDNESADIDDGNAAEALRTIAVSESDVRAAKRLLARISTVGDVIDADVPEPLPIRSIANVSEAALRKRARVAFERRRRRAQVFGQSMFGEPAWDMLLALYILEEFSGRHTVGRLMEYAETPSTTGLRWLQYLVSKQLVIREEHPHDRRSYLVRLSSKARELLTVYFSEFVDSDLQP